MEKFINLLKQIGQYIAKTWLFLSKVIGSLVLGFIILVIIIVATASKSSQEGLQTAKVLKPGGLDQIAVLKLSGEIMELDGGNNIFEFNPFIITPTRTREIFQKLAQDDLVKGIVIRVNSPGGSVVSSEEIYQQIKALREIKPVVVSFGEVAASGGYYIASAADQIVANPATITGSIGVIAIAPNISGLYDKLGVEVTTFKTGTYKDMGSMARKVTKEEKEIFKSILDDSYDLFINAIVSGREMDETTVRQLADGRIYSGKQARENGLVDKLGGMDTAVDMVAELAGVSDPTVVEYSTFGWWEGLLGISSNAVFPKTILNQLLPQRSMGVYYLWE